MPDEQKPDRPESGGQQNKKKKNQESNRFKGFIDGLEQSVFDTQVNARNADAFNTSMRRIAEHIARTTTNGGEFLQALNPEALGFSEILNQTTHPATRPWLTWKNGSTNTATGMTGPTADKKQAEPRSRSYSANAPRQYGQE